MPECDKNRALDRKGSTGFLEPIYFDNFNTDICNPQFCFYKSCNKIIKDLLGAAVKKWSKSSYATK